MRTNRSKKAPTHDIAGLWWDLGTYSTGYNQNKHKYAWFDTTKHIVSHNNTATAKGDNYTNVQYHFRVHVSTLSKFIPEECDTIYRKLKDEYLRVSVSAFHNLQKN